MIEIEKTTVVKVGSCNNCSRFHRIVFQIKIALLNNGIVIRLCNNCKKELQEKLKLIK